MVWDVAPLAITTQDVSRPDAPKQKSSDESFVKLPESERGEESGSRDDKIPVLQASNPFLDQPQTAIQLAVPIPTRPLHGKNVTFAQTIQEISPIAEVTASPIDESERLPAQRTVNSLSEWTEHILPDTSYYYTLPAHLSPTQTPVVTDMDLRSPHKLRVVEAYLRTMSSRDKSVLESPNPPMPEPATPSEAAKTTWQQFFNPPMPVPLTTDGKDGLVEVYLRNVAPRTKQNSGEFVPLTTYVRHGVRTASLSPPGQETHMSDADRLEQETQYWTYMETHPAHVPLPIEATEEAFEALTWSYTDRVLQSRTGSSAGTPFSERECHELLELLRGLLDAPKTRHATLTRIVAKIHLRTAQWRQQFVALGDSGGYPPRKRSDPFTMSVSDPPNASRSGIPFKHTLSRFFFGVLCLGIPYLFFSSRRSTDFEQDDDATTGGGWSYRGAASLVMTAGVWLVGAVMLSVSVTFLALPGLERLARILALVSVICSIGSLAASFLVFPRRPGSAITFTKARALPAVLLAYAVASFVGATISYAANGTTPQTPRSTLQGFGSLTGWIVVGVWAVLATVLAAAAWMLRSPSTPRGYRALPS